MKTKITITLLFCTSLIYGQLVPNNLLLHLPFSGNADDASPHNRDGVVYGATLTDDRFGNPNSAYLFDGVDDYISIGDDNYSIIDELSMSVWVKTSSSSYQWIAGKYMWQEDQGYHLTTSNSELNMAGRDGNAIYTSVNSNTIVGNNAWRHIVGTINGSVWQIWIDGVLIETYDTHHTNVDYRSTANLEIGRYFFTNNEYFSGAIDDFRMYDRVLTQKEVEILYNESSEYVTINDAEDIGIHIYPNPTKDIAKVKLNGNHISSCLIYDFKGQLIEKINVTDDTFTINLSNIQNEGIYFARFIDGDGKCSLVQKIILQ